MNFHQTLAEALPEAVFVLDSQARLVYANPHCYALTGYERAELEQTEISFLLGRPAPDLKTACHPETGLTVSRTWPQLQLFPKNQSPRTVDLLLAPLEPARGEKVFLGLLQVPGQTEEALHQLRQSEQKYRLLAENANDIIWTMDLNLQLTYISPAVERIRGLTPEEALVQPLEQALPPASLERVRHYFQKTLELEESPNQLGESSTALFLELEYFHKNGHTVWVENSLSLMRDDHGRLMGIFGISRDITARKQAEDALNQSETRSRIILEEIQDAYYEVDHRGDFIFANRQMGNLLGYSEEELLDKNYSHFMDAVNAELVFHKFNKVFRTGQPDSGFDWELIRQDGGKRWVNASISLITDVRGRKMGFRGIIRDMTRHKEMENDLLRMAYYDELTGLANRSLLQDNFTKAIARAYRYETLMAVFVVDMNQTKEINDTLGHQAGDELIRDLARRLKAAVRESDTVARTGGDEFIILGEAIQQVEGAQILGEKILRLVREEPFEIQGHTIYQEVSVGYSLYPIDGADPESLLKQADVAMYHAKECHSKQPHRYSPQTDLLSAEFSLARELRKAVENDEFLIYYQPQVNLQTAEVIGMEALLRWDHPQHGIIEPSDFIPVLERTGLIREVGLSVETKVCRQIADWKTDTPTIPQQTINCCVYEISNPSMLAELQGIIERFGVNPREIGIEITERVATRNIEEVRKILQALSEQGITILLDDFGTGYSSLTLLQKLPIDIVKIDKSFIHDMFEDAYSASLVRATITMCHETDKKVMAEGIENQAQLEFLQSLSCDYGQGFYFGKPAPAGPFPAIRLSDPN